MRTRIAVACVACLCALVPAAFAQYGAQVVAPEPQMKSDEAIPIGPFLFSPAVQLTWEARDNIYYTPDNEVADNIYTARALLMFELPIYDNYIRFSYNPQYREFRKYDFREHWTNAVEVTGAFEFPTGLKLTPTYQYISGALEVREIDPGGELMYGDQRFTKNHFGLNADYWFTSRDGLRVDGTYDDITYKYDTAHRPPCPAGIECYFYNYAQLMGGIGWLHQLSPTLVMDLEYRRTEMNSEATLDYRDQSSNEMTVGLEGQITPLLASGLRAGWRETTPDTAAGDPHIAKYSDLDVNGYLGYALAQQSTLRLDLLYTDYPSNFGTNAFYTARGASLMYGLQRERLSGQARIRFQNNSYSEPDPISNRHRSDKIKTLDLGLNYRLNDLVSLSGGYVYEDRDSLHNYSYTASTFLLSVVVGFGFGY